MDILMRYFLVAPEIEKIHLRGLILIANREIKNLGLSGSPTTDQEDAAAIVQAYVHLLTPPLSKYITAHVDLDVASILTDYVACVSQVNLERTTDISRCALERLWAEFDEEERNPIPRERLESKRKLMGAMLISVRRVVYYRFSFMCNNSILDCYKRLLKTISRHESSSQRCLMRWMRLS